MLSVQELRRLVTSLDFPAFERQLGPFALMERPPNEQVQLAALQLGARRTVAQRGTPGRDGLSLLFELDHLLVATLPPVAQQPTLLVGRMPDCELVIDDPSVSKHHARITWLSETGQALVEDLGSSNGTWLNGEPLQATATLRDGDQLGFGETRFLYLLTRSLHGKLVGGA